MLMVAGVVYAAFQQQWLTGLVIVGIILLSFLPTALHRRYNLYIPSEFELLAILLLFGSLFLGEVRQYYFRFWWWDLALHTLSGFILGIFGFLLVYVLNRHERAHLDMTAGFVAFFSFLFSVACGVFWEIFEFAMDQIFGWNMQKSGLVDTMWDLIVDTFGAAVIALLAYIFLKDEHEYFLERWIAKFIAGNPRLFRRHKQKKPSASK
jgi:hypothetical protein